MTKPIALKEALHLVARFCPVTTPPEPPKPITGQRRWPRVRELMKDRPMTYRKLARRMKIKPKNANELLHRLAARGLIVVVTPGRKGYAGPATVFGLPNASATVRQEVKL